MSEGNILCNGLRSSQKSMFRKEHTKDARIKEHESMIKESILTQKSA